MNSYVKCIDNYLASNLEKNKTYRVISYKLFKVCDNFLIQYLIYDGNKKKYYSSRRFKNIGGICK